MTYQGFENFCRETSYVHDYKMGDWRQSDKVAPFIYIEWRTGGMSGGDCWGGTPSYCSRSEPEPEFTEFDNILNAIKPEITYLQYKSLCAEVIDSDSRTQYEYYGNSDSYLYKKVELEKLYNALIARGFINS